MIKKIVVTVNLKDLTEAKFIEKTTGMAQAAIDNPTIVPALNPAATVVLTKTQSLAMLLVHRDNLRTEQMQNTGQIIDAITDITNVITDQWAPYVQQVIAGDKNKAKLLGYGIKGEYDGHTDDVVAMAADSYPVISRIESTAHLQHTLHTINSRSGHNKLPKDAKQIDIYEQIGGTAPIDIKQMQYIGITKRGKFINHFEAEDIGKTVYYIAVYIDKKTLKPLEQSPVKVATIN